MSQDEARLADYLEHIVTAIERISTYVEDLTEPAFLANELVQDAVIRNFEVIGEASRNIERRYPEFVVAHPDLPLIAAYEMRNALSHGYFKVDLEIVWKTIHADLPALRGRVAEILIKDRGGAKS
jgi:uncharacterized protein with HEPN domain